MFIVRSIWEGDYVTPPGLIAEHERADLTAAQAIFDLHIAAWDQYGDPTGVTVQMIDPTGSVIAEHHYA